MNLDFIEAPKLEAGQNLAKILCIEDDDDIRSEIVFELNIWGHETIEAANGREGYDLIQSDTPDLVLCDISMPAMNGFQLLSKIRADHQIYSAIPFVFLSALNSKDDIIVGRRLGCDDYLAKPIDFDILLATISSRLAQTKRMEISRRAELNQVRQTVLTMIPHELRTPLNHILGYSEILASEIFGPLGDHRYREMAENVLEGGKHLSDIVEGALALIDASVAQQKPELEPCDLFQLIEDCVRQMRGAAEKSGVRIVTRLPSAEPKFETSHGIFKRSLLALISNAIKFNKPDGMVRVGIDTTPYGGLEIYVSDTGIGMNKADIEKAQWMFVQLDNGHDRQFDGTGLGLPIARISVELLGGSLSIDSETGTGTKAIMHFWRSDTEQ
ncbi:MAG: response regulator [Rhodospirillales bacterium]|nr:response regulator [Rhodospirillales bacterium]